MTFVKKSVVIGICYLMVALGISGCGSLSRLSSDMPDNAPLSSLEEDSFHYLEDVLLVSPTTNLTEEQRAEVAGLEAEGVAAQRADKMADAVSAMEKVLLLDRYNATANFVLGIHDVNTLASDTVAREEINRIARLVSDEIQLNHLSDGDVVLSDGGDVGAGILDHVLFVTSTQNKLVQDALEVLSTHIPRLNTAIIRLERILMHSDFDYHLLNESLDIDYTVTRQDLLRIYAGLNVVRSFLDMGLAYDVSFKDTEYPSVETFLSQNAKFLTLKPNGVKHMQRAGIGFANAVTATLLYDKHALNPMPQETRSWLQKAQRSFRGETVDISITLKSVDDKTSVPHILSVNLGNYFNSPIEDFRKYMGVNIKGKLANSSFPEGFDFTLGGLFPDLKGYEDWQRYNSFGLVFYNTDTSGEAPYSIGRYNTSIQKNGSLLLVSGKYSYESHVADVFRVSDTGHVRRIGMLKKEPFEEASYSYYSAITLSDRYIYRAYRGSVVLIYDTQGDVLKEVSRITLSTDVLKLHVYQNALYVATYTGVACYDISLPTEPRFVRHISFVQNTYGAERAVFHKNELTLLGAFWGYYSGYTNMLHNYDLISGEHRQLLVDESAYIYDFDIGYDQRDNPVVIFRNMYTDRVNVRWFSGETASFDSYFKGGSRFVIANGVAVETNLDSADAVVYDVKNPGTIRQLNSYRALPNATILAAALPLREGVWTYTLDGNASFFPY